MHKIIITQKNGKARSEYYENNKERLQKQAQNSHGNLSKEERDQKRECGEHGRNKQKISSKKI